MGELPTGATLVATEIGAIASSRTSLRQRARELLEPLHRILPFEGASLVVLNDDTLRFESLASIGYTSAIQAYYRSEQFFHEVEMVGMARNRPPMRLRDLPVPAEELPVWAEHLRPAGYREGLAVTLFAPDGRHLGLLTMHTESSTAPAEEVRDFVGAIAPLIANAVDPMRSLATLARMVDDAYAGVVLTRAGHCLPLCGLPGDALLRPDSAAVRAATRMVAAGQLHSSFLCPVDNRHVRLTALSCPEDLPRHLRAVLLLSPVRNLVGLTRRELEVLGLLVEGWPNQQIAAAFTVADRTVTTHVEHILAKLGIRSRTLAAVRALRLGLYIPRPLNGVH